MDYEVTPKSRDDIRTLARILRSFLGIDDVYFDITKILENLHQFDEDFVLEVIEDTKFQDKYAETFTDISRIKVRESTYVGACNGNPRDRFTLCHELGHYIMHHKSTVIGLARKSNEINPTPAFRSAEWQANTFAGELLAPYEVTKNYTLDELIIKCGMSESSARIQYREYRKY